MKPIQNLGLALLLFVFAIGCNINAQQSAKEMLKDAVKQREIFGAICSDSMQMKQFMQYMMQNKNTMQMMASNHKVMMNMMQEDTAMCKMMMGNMMDMMEKDSSRCKMMRRQMMKNMHMKGMMDCSMTKKEMMCPVHDKMNSGEMKKEEMKHQHKK